MNAACQRLDRVLQVLGQRQLGPAELRVLLALVESDATVPQLASVLGEDPGGIAETGRRLALRGLVRQRRTGADRATVLGLNRGGLREIRPLITAASNGESPPEDR